MQRLLAATAALFVLAGCGGATTMPDPGTPTDICNWPAVPEFTLVSPAPGATGVSDSTAALVFSGALYDRSDASESIVLVASNGGQYVLTTFNPTNGGYNVQLPTLTSGTKYTVDYVITNNGVVAQACKSLSNTLGSFTTQ